MRTGNNVNRNELAKSRSGNASSLGSSLNSSDVTSYHNGNESRTDLLSSDKLNVSSLNHCVRSLYCGNKTSGLNHSKCQKCHNN